MSRRNRGDVQGGDVTLRFLVFWVKQHTWDVTEWCGLTAQPEPVELLARTARHEAETLQHHNAALLHGTLERDWLQQDREANTNR